MKRISGIEVLSLSLLVLSIVFGLQRISEATLPSWIPDSCDEGSYRFGWVIIDSPTKEPTYITGEPSIYLIGRAFESKRVNYPCRGGTAEEITGVTVTWKNCTTGESGKAYQGLDPGTMLPVCIHKWAAQVTLVWGDNVIAVTAYDQSGEWGRDVIKVWRPALPPPTLVSPKGEINTNKPTYTWNAVSNAAWYHLWVNDLTGNKINQWYTAEQTGCASGTGTCSMTPPTEVIGSCQWWVQAYNSAGFGSWSTPFSFTTPIPTPPITATQISPSGETADNTPTYIWNPVSNSTWYCLYVNDSTGNKIQQWYAASDAGCDGTGPCSVTPAVALAPGAGQWWIRTYNSGGYGPWSTGKSFIILTQSLYDDFSGTSINKDKWKEGEFVREIQGGKLVSKATAYGSRVTNNLNFKDPVPITYIEADVIVDKIEGDYDPDDSTKYSLPNARLTGFFYNDGTASGPGSHKGEVQGIIRIVLYRGKLSAQWAVEKSLDDAATSWTTLGSEIFSDPISLNIPYKLSIQFEPSLKRFTFKVGTSTSTWTSTDTIKPSNTPWKAIGTDVDFYPTTPSLFYGKISATFDNVIAKDESGAVLVSDDFTSSTLDQTKWNTYESVREISEGKLRSKVRSSSGSTSPVYSNLDFLYPSSIDLIQTKVTPVTYQNSQGANAAARIAGYYYNDGTGTGTQGDHTGDVGAQVFIGGTGVNPVALWVVFRSTDSAGEVPAAVASGTFTTPISLGNTYTLSLRWDGSRFTFKIDNEEANYTPVTTIKPPNCPWKAIGTRIWDPANKEATIEALFDDVMAYYSPPGAATLISPSGTITDTTPTYTWNAVSDATWYRLWVNDSTGNKIQQWYTASAAGCTDGVGTCSVTPTTEVGGSCQWWVQTYNIAGYGPWSAPLSFTTTPPAATTLVSPSGTITDTTPTYTWNAVSNSTWYCLYVNDSTGNKIYQWYTAEQVNCSSGTGQCYVTPTTEVVGSCQWWIRTYNTAGYGPWSTTMSFTTPIPTSPPAATLISPSGTIKDTTPTYTWNAVSNAMWYRLWVNDSTGNKIQQWYTASSVGCADGVGICSVTPTTEVIGSCQWWIQTYNNIGYGPWSAPLSFTTQLSTSPNLSFVYIPPEPFGLLTTDSIIWQSDQDGNYITELGGDGTIGTGIQLASGWVTANTSVNHIIKGAQLEFGASNPLWIYVTNQLGHTGSISLDLSTKLLVSIPIGGELSDIKILPNGQKAYVNNVDGDEVVVIDTDPQSSSYNTVTNIVPVGIRPHGIAITPDGTRVYVTNSGASSLDIDSISVISTPTDSVIATTPLRSNTAPGGIAITPDGTRGYFTTFEEMVRIIDTDPSSATYNQEVDYINRILLLFGRIAITPDGTKAVVNWQGSIAHGVDVIDVDPLSPSYNTLIASPVPVISGLHGDIAISADSNFAYLTSTYDNCRLCKIDLQTYNVLVNYPVSHVGGIELTPDSLTLLFTDSNDKKIYVFNSSDLSLIGSVDLGANLGRNIAITPDGTRAYIFRDQISSNSEVLMVPLF